MAKVVEDRQSSYGQWVGYFSENGKKYVTRLKKAYEHMLERCLIGGSFQKKYPTYAGCRSDFESFQQFAVWAVSQPGYCQIDAHLDKDLLFKGNKVYSESTCVFIPQRINKLLLRSDAKRKLKAGQLPLGVSWDSSRKKYRAQIGQQGNRGIGRFDTVEQAFAAYREEKEAYIARQAVQYRDLLDPRVYQALLNYRVAVTD